MPYPPIAPDPSTFTMTTGETVPLELNTTPLSGGPVLSASCVLTDMSVGRGVVIGGLPGVVVAAPFITQQVPGALLVAGHIFRLAFTWSPVSGTTWEQILTIQVPA